MEQSETWACAGMGRLFNGCSATGEIYMWQQWLAVSSLVWQLQGPAHACLNVRTGHITNTKQGDFCCLVVIWKWRDFIFLLKEDFFSFPCHWGAL